MKKDTILLTGYAKLPSTITAHHLYKVVVIAVEIKGEEGEIVEVDCSLATQAARNYVKDVIKGYKLCEGISGLVKRIEEGYHGSAQKAIIVAIKNIYRTYLEVKDSVSKKKEKKE